MKAVSLLVVSCILLVSVVVIRVFVIQGRTLPTAFIHEHRQLADVIRVLEKVEQQLEKVVSQHKGEKNFSKHSVPPHNSKRSASFFRDVELSLATRRKPVLPNSRQDSIFVSLASYRDDQCAPTIRDLFAKALDPESIFVGVVQQHFPTDPTCVPSEFKKCQDVGSFCPTDQIRVRIIHPSKARGPTFGRFVGMYMYRGEKYVFMMDSHNRFVTGWDQILVKMYKTLGVPKGVLSHYPEAWNNPDDGQTNQPLDNRGTTTYLCTAKFVDWGVPRLDGFVVPKTNRPRPQPWAAAGFLFADAQLLQEVKFDPHLDYVFDGEEILYSARMWTSGWDIFSPSENVMYHYYYRTKAHKFWGLLPGDWTVKRDQANRRIQYLMGATLPGTMQRYIPLNTTEREILVDIGKYSMGTTRTLEDWWSWSGLDRRGRKLEDRWCSRHT